MKRCAYCNSSIDVGVDHVIPFSIMTSAKRRGGAHSYGDTVPCCSECNTILGNRYLLNKAKRALFLVEEYARKLNFYEDDDSRVLLLDKIKGCILNYENFMLEMADDGDAETEVVQTEDAPSAEDCRRFRSKKNDCIDMLRCIFAIPANAKIITLSDIERLTLPKIYQMVESGESDGVFLCDIDALEMLHSADKFKLIRRAIMISPGPKNFSALISKINTMPDMGVETFIKATPFIKILWSRFDMREVVSGYAKIKSLWRV